MEGTSFRKERVTLRPGDKLFLYTDGVTEAEDEKHTLYGEDRLQKCLAPLGNADPAAVIAAVRADLERHVKGYTQFDDITMLCLRQNAPPETPADKQ
jgi:sigma-B regulation protein RsbU (phosphoserine phosphatase)